MLRKILPVALLAVAAGGPVAWYAAPDYWKAFRRQWFSSSQTAGAQTASLDFLPEAGSSESPPRPLEGPPTQDLGEVLRFQGVTTGWVLGRWPRVATGLAELPLQGYRVPLVTGTKEQDLAGSLTYYFNAHQEVQRISFQGTTGDPRALIRHLTSQYKFTRRLTNDPGLFVYEVRDPTGEPKSVLTIRSAPVVKSSQRHGRFKVELRLERPS